MVGSGMLLCFMILITVFNTGSIISWKCWFVISSLNQVSCWQTTFYNGWYLVDCFCYEHCCFLGCIINLFSVLWCMIRNNQVKTWRKKTTRFNCNRYTKINIWNQPVFWHSNYKNIISSNGSCFDIKPLVITAYKIDTIKIERFTL